MPFLFSYGTLQKQSVQLELFGRILIAAKDRLIGYKLTPIEIKDNTFLARGEQANQLTITITNNKADTINGMALEVSEEDLIEADKYEPDNYKRIEVELESGEKAWIYLAAE